MFVLGTRGSVWKHQGDVSSNYRLERDVLYLSNERDRKVGDYSRGL